MSLYLKFFVFVTVLAFALNLMSCQKKSVIEYPAGIITNQTISQPFNLLNYKTAVSDTLIGTLYYAKNNVDFQFFGDIDASGTIQKVSAISFRRHNTKDTVYNATFDDNTRIKTLFITINGNIDTSISKYSYGDSVIIQSIYHLDAKTQISKLEKQIIIDSATHNINKVTTFGTSDTKFILGVALNTVLIVEGYGILAGIAAGAAVTVALPAVIIGGGLLLYGASSIVSLTTGKVNSVATEIGNLLIPSSGAAEIDTYPTNIPYNPSDYVAKVDKANGSNNLWHWCACQFNTGLNGFDINLNRGIWGSFGFSVLQSAIYISSEELSKIGGEDCYGASGNCFGKISFYLASGNSTYVRYHALLLLCDNGIEISKDTVITSHLFTCSD